MWVSPFALLPFRASFRFFWSVGVPFRCSLFVPFRFSLLVLRMCAGWSGKAAVGAESWPVSRAER